MDMFNAYVSGRNVYRQNQADQRQSAAMKGLSAYLGQGDEAALQSVYENDPMLALEAKKMRGQEQQIDSERRRSEFERRAKFVLNLPPEQRAVAYPQIKAQYAQIDPEIAGMLPEQWSDDLIPAIQEAIGGGQQEIGIDQLSPRMRSLAILRQQGAISEDDYQIAARIEAGLDPRAAAPGYTAQKVWNPETRQYEFQRIQTRGLSYPQTQPQQQAQDITASIAESANRMIAEDIPPEQVEAWAGQQMQANRPAGMQVQRGPVAGGVGGGMAAGPSAEEEAQIAAERIRAETVAKSEAQKQIDAPGAMQKADETVALIDLALNHPGRRTATGFSGAIDPRNYVPGTDATDFRVVLDQLGGRAFLEAFESLKGGGQITEVEGRKATEAMARLSRAQSDEAFETALRELRDIAVSARARAERSAARPQAGQQAAPDDDALINKYLD